MKLWKPLALIVAALWVYIAFFSNAAHADWICAKEECEMVLWIDGSPRKMKFLRGDVVGLKDGAVYQGEPGWKHISAYRLDLVRQTATIVP